MHIFFYSYAYIYTYIYMYIYIYMCVYIYAYSSCHCAWRTEDTRALCTFETHTKNVKFFAYSCCPCVWPIETYEVEYYFLSFEKESKSTSCATSCARRVLSLCTWSGTPCRFEHLLAHTMLHNILLHKILLHNILLHKILLHNILLHNILLCKAHYFAVHKMWHTIALRVVQHNILPYT